MKALLIPVDGKLAMIEINAVEGDDGLADLQAAVGGHIEALPVPGYPKAIAYINDNGKFALDRNPLATALLKEAMMVGDWIPGPCVLMGIDGENNADVPERLLRPVGAIS